MNNYFTTHNIHMFIFDIIYNSFFYNSAIKYITIVINKFKVWRKEYLDSDILL